MRAITKSAKRHPAAKKCCGWEEPAICGGPDQFQGSAQAQAEQYNQKIDKIPIPGLMKPNLCLT